MRLNRKGFTLIELLVTVAIIALVVGFSVFGIMNVINNSKEKVTVISEKSVKEAATIYSSEMGSSSWKSGSEYDAFCVTVGELINKGLLEKNSVFDNKDINKNTYVIVKRNNITFSIISEEIVPDIIGNEYNKICTGQNATGESYTNPSINNHISYTDRLEISFKDGTANSGVKNYKCFYGESSSNISKEGIIDGNNCILNGLKNNTDYQVFIYMNTNAGSNVLATGDRSYTTSDFNKTTFTQDKNVITINYNNKDTNGNNINNPGYYFNSNIDGISNVNLEVCVLENNVYTCTGNVKEIRENTWYKSATNEVKITYPEENNEVSIDARITDGSNNYRIDNGAFTIKKYIVKFYKNNAISIDGNTNSFVEKYCIAKDTDSCTVISPNIKEPIGYYVIGWSTSASSSTSSWNVNTSKNIEGNYEYYAIVKPYRINITYSVNGGVIKSSTTSDEGTVYNWTTSDDLIYKNNKILKNGYNYGDNISSNGLANYNNTEYIYITKKGYNVEENSEWKCISGCTNDGKIFDQYTSYSTSEFCDASYGDCDVMVGVNWIPNTYTLVYNSNGGIGTTSSSSHVYDESKLLTANGFSRAGYTFKGWATSATGNVVYTDKESVKNLTDTNDDTVNLYAVWEANELNFETQSFDLTYSSDVQTISFTGASNGTGTYIYSLSGSGSSYFTISGNSLSIKQETPADKYTLTVTVKDSNSNSSKTATFIVNISKKAATITAKMQTINYGESINKDISQIIPFGFLDGHSVSSITLNASTTNATSNGTINPSGAIIKNSSDVDVTSNYDITYNIGKLIINKISNTLSVVANSLVYNGTSQTLVTVSGGNGPVYYSTSIQLTSSNYSSSGTTTIPSEINAGSYTVYYYTPGNTNYNDKSGSVLVPIAKKVLTTTVSANNKTYDGSTDATCKVSLSGAVSGQDPTATSTGAFSNADVGNTKEVTCSNITLGSSWTSNYRLDATSKTTTASISVKSIAVSWGSTVGWVYDGNSHIPSASISTGVSGETMSLSVSGAKTNAGSHTATASCNSVSGGRGVCSNYTLTNTTKTFSITKASCSCTILEVPSGLKYPGSSSGTVKYSCGGDGTISVASSNTSVVTASTPGSSSAILTVKGVGTSKITLGRSAGTNYNACSSDSESLSVAQGVYTITYNANGGSGAPGSQTATAGVDTKLSTTKPIRANYEFNGWNTKSDGTGTNYSSGANYNGSSDVTLYAKWKTHVHTWNAVGNTLRTTGTTQPFTCGYAHTKAYSRYCGTCGMSYYYYRHVLGLGNDGTLACPCEHGAPIMFDDSSINDRTQVGTTGGQAMLSKVSSKKELCSEHSSN